MKAGVLGIESLGDQRTAIQVPAGEVIEVLSGPKPDDKRMVDVRWGERTLVMFTEDITSRSEEIRSASAPEKV